MRFNYLSLSVKSKRSQSALEYMMTYGWAILIIVIVAVILYSMGIFNPSSSITFTSSGFSPFTVSSSLCNNIGYKIAVLAGPIPNNANSITINKVFLTSATGANTTTASYTLTNPVTLKSGQSATILIPNVACNSANTHYSLSAKIQYSYTASTLGLQNVNTTGTVAGTSITGKPSTLTSYEPITITNTQSSATPSPFQQMINFTSSDPGFSSIATGNFGQNVEFFYYNGTIIPSWLENYTSTNGLWWLKVAAIPGGSSETVYVGFAQASTNLFNTVNDGEAPQIPCGSTPTSSCSTYGEYDDGTEVFTYYWNFFGKSIPSAWSGDNFNGFIDNGVYLDNSNWGGLFGPTLNFSVYSFLIGMYLNVTGNGDMALGTNSGSSVAGGGDPYTLSTGRMRPYAEIGGALNLVTFFTGWINNSDDNFLENLQTGKIVFDTDHEGISESMRLGSDSIGTQAYISVFAIRVLPSNAIMPSVSFGGLYQ